MEAGVLPDPRDGVHEQPERDPDRVEDGRLAPTILGDQHGELPVELDLALLEATEVA
jgi:hypothetical protein